MIQAELSNIPWQVPAQPSASVPWPLMVPYLPAAHKVHDSCPDADHLPATHKFAVVVKDIALQLYPACPHPVDIKCAIRDTLGAECTGFAFELKCPSTSTCTVSPGH